MENVSTFIMALFILTTVVSVWLFSRTTSKPRILLFIIAIFMGVQAILGLNGFYAHGSGLPPRFAFLIGPPLLLIILVFIMPQGRRWMNRLDMGKLTILHVIRIPVEIVLFNVFLAGLIPELMTFEGYNFDILSGISSVAIYCLCFVFKRAGKTTLLVWNVVCLLLLVNVLTIAILSLPTPFQRMAFEQPNIGVAYFPFVWLPGIIVPVVLFSHMASIRRLILGEEIARVKKQVLPI